MQLQMTAPLDIGLEHTDPTLRNGQDDIFDLEETEKRLRKQGGMDRLMDGADDDSEDEEVEDEEDEEVLDAEEERERKVQEMEQDLDGLYESYQEHMRERDAKYRVKEARKKDKAREEWAGIQENDSDEGESDEGGWDTVQAAKARAGEDSDSSDGEDEDEDEGEGRKLAAAATQPSKKRRRAEDVVDLTGGRKKVRLNANVKPVGGADTKLSRTAEVWFSQDFFKSAGLDDVEDDEDMVEDENDQDGDITMDGASLPPPEAEEVRRQNE